MPSRKGGSKTRNNPILADLFKIKVDLALIKQELKLHRWVLSTIVVMLIMILAKVILG